MLETWRVAQIVVDRGPGSNGSRGSGYLVAPGLVLTAAHVVAGAGAVRVRLDVGQRTEVDVSSERWWADPEGSNGTDLAVVTIPAEATAGRDVEPARFGRVSGGMAVLAVRASGFPGFKLHRSAGGQGVFRDLEQVSGHAPVAANRRQGTLAVYLDDPAPAAPEPGDPSPWAGMSGAAVWAAGRIIGVVAEHHPGEGTGRLTSRRIDRSYEQLPESDLDRLVQWLGLAPAIGGLPDVLPAGPGQLFRSAYLEQVHDIAPDALIGRDGELAEWVEFCVGPETYAWWQAGPWAGKTALASWFVTHPPDGVDIVSFFITGSVAGQADSDAFLNAMIKQLNALDPAGEESAAVAGARVGAWLSLLASMAAQAEERGRRLVVVVDGLDQDDAGATPARGRPSIASLLPRRPPYGLRFIITSRPDPGLPDDVPSGHPLRTCIPRRLPVSPVAQDLALRARQELRDLLTGDQTAIDVVGYIAGSGGSLSGSDLSALTGAPPLKLDPILHGVSGRSLQTRPSTDSLNTGPDPATRVYLFAHDTLRVTAEEQLGAELADYREGIHDWIASYAMGGWPDTTPGYALRGYPRLLTATSDVTRLSALARTPRRHAFLLRATGSDYAALAEIRAAQLLIAGRNVPDLQALVELAVYRHAISIRNQSIPVGLPAVWARLARFDHAEALARTITDPDDQAQALAAVASAAAQAGDPDRAEALARGITDPYARAQALAAVASAAAQAGDPDRAEALARGITDPYARAQALAAVASAAAQAGDPDRAEALARGITDPYARAQALAGLASAAAQAGDLDRASRMAADAEAVARTITDPDAQARALAGLAGAAAQAGDPDRASRMAADAEAVARTITDPDARAQALAGLASAAAQAGDPDRASRMAADAEAVARTITDPDARAQALAGLASAAAQAGDLDRASRMAADAEAVARSITDPDARAQALAAVATAAAQAGDPDRAEALARSITDPDAQAQALAAVASAAAQAGDLDRASRMAADAEAVAHDITDPDARAQALAAVATAAAQAGDLDRASRMAADAEALARTITDPYDQAQALAGLASAAAQAGDPDRAEALARDITDPDARAQALAAVASAAAQAGDLDRAYRMAADAEAVARTITDPDARAQALTMASAAAQAGDPDRAEALARGITDPGARAQALAAVASAAAQAGDPDRAEALARDITDPGARAQALAGLASAAAQAGDLDRASRMAADAEAVARDITDPDARAQALAAVASAAAQAGDLDRASRMAADAEAVARTITDPYDQAQALAGLASAAAQAGDRDRASRMAADAEALARTITDPYDQAQALAAVASAAAQAGDPDRAEALARGITDPGDQAQALAAVARAAAQAGDPDRARRLMALALSADSSEIRWWIDGVSHLFPSAIRGAGDVFISAYKTGS